jgi:hypothetical protein
MASLFQGHPFPTRRTKKQVTKSLAARVLLHELFLIRSIFLRLETALIANQERLKIREARQRQAAETGAKVTQQVPSIKLTMDFASKFAAK